MNDIKKKRYGILGPEVVKAMEKRCFEAYYFETAAEAKEKALELIAPDAKVGYGGSVTLNELELKEALRERGNNLLDRDLAADFAERAKLQQEAFSADWYMMSANAITEDGQLVNIDGVGNRVAALIYGPRNVLVIAGMNKVVKTLDDAWSRARNTAAPANMTRFDMLKAPCKATGACADCISPDCICNQLVNTRRSMPPKRIKVILVGEDLGL